MGHTETPRKRRKFIAAIARARNVSVCPSRCAGGHHGAIPTLRRRRMRRILLSRLLFRTLSFDDIARRRILSRTKWIIRGQWFLRSRTIWHLFRIIFSGRKHSRFTVGVRGGGGRLYGFGVQKDGSFMPGKVCITFFWVISGG